MLQICACGSEKKYLDCCGRFIENNEIPATPEELMRSRYTAYTQINIDYIQRTMRAPALDRFDVQETKKWAEAVTWERLEVVDSKIDGVIGFVEFYAHFHIKNKKYVMRELSEFHLLDNAWYYVNGQDRNSNMVLKSSSIGRNEPCPCKSGKKYKKCCGI